jgi:hypothetical protein
VSSSCVVVAGEASSAASLELASDAQLLVFGHRGARGLLAVAQSGVKNDQLVAHVAAPVEEKSWPKNKRPVALAYGP